MNLVADRQNTGPQTEDGDAKPMGWHGQIENGGGVTRATGPIMIADGRDNQKVDLEVGEQRKEQKKIPRIYDVDESMSLQRMTRKDKAAGRDRSLKSGNVHDYQMLGGQQNQQHKVLDRGENQIYQQ